MSRGLDAYAGLLRRCGSSKALSAGMRAHDSIIRSGHPPDVLLYNLIVQMYGNCGAVHDARAVFDHMPQHNVFSWNLMMGAYVSNKYGNSSLELFHHMHSECVAAPDEITFITALSSCVDASASSSQGAWLHQIIVLCGFDCHVVVATALVSMYGKCGRLEHARWTFDNMPNRNLFSWNAMLAAYAYHEQLKKIIQLLHQMLLEDMIPDRVTCISAVSACGSQEFLDEGKRLHASIVGSIFETDIALQNALISLYGKCGSQKDAGRVFHAMPERNLITWNAMIAACAQARQTREAMDFFTQMQLEGVVPDEVTFSSIFSAFANKGVYSEGKCMHARVTGCVHESDVVVRTAIITMYGNCGSVGDARTMFNKMAKKNIAVWNSMITAYAQHGNIEEAMGLFHEMHFENLNPDKVTFVTVLSVCADEASLTQGKWIHKHIVSCGINVDLEIGNSLVNFYGKCGTLEDALEVFCAMCERNLVSWSSLIASYTQHERAKEALQLFEKMLMAGMIPDKVIFSCILPACATEATLAQGKQMHHYIVSSDFEEDAVVRTALVNMYSKCGSLKDAQRMFDRITNRTLVSWNSVIAAYTHHGQGVEALTYFDQMHHEGLIPDECTFQSILSACSHTGLLEEGYHYFISMVRHYCIAPTVEHFNCMIDLFGRAGQLDEVEGLIKTMPLQPTGTSWMTLLGACRVHLDRTRGKYASKQVFDLDPENTTPLVLLSNVYTAAGSWQDAMKGIISCGWDGS